MAEAISKHTTFNPEQLKALGEAYQFGCEALAFAIAEAPEPLAEKRRNELAQLILEIAATGESNPKRICMIALARMPPLEASIEKPLIHNVGSANSLSGGADAETARDLNT